MLDDSCDEDEVVVTAEEADWLGQIGAELAETKTLECDRKALECERGALEEDDADAEGTAEVELAWPADESDDDDEIGWAVADALAECVTGNDVLADPCAAVVVALSPAPKCAWSVGRTQTVCVVVICTMMVVVAVMGIPRSSSSTPSPRSYILP